MVGRRTFFTALIVTGFAATGAAQTIVDTTATIDLATATAIPGNGQSSFGGAIGGATLTLDSDDTGRIEGQLAPGGLLNDWAVIYVDSVPDAGVTSTEPLTDEVDDGRRGVSGLSGDVASTLVFPEGFAPDFALAVSWEHGVFAFGLNDDPTNLTFVGTLGDGGADGVVDFALDATDIGLTAGGTFTAMVTYLNPWSQWRSDEYMGAGISVDTTGSVEPPATVTVADDSELIAFTLYSTCGDGALDAGEACDDGNLVAGDGCDAACALEDGWVCETAGAACACAEGYDGPTCDDIDECGVDPAALTITGAFDGPLSGGTPKGVELYAAVDIPDLSIYGIGSANNGGGTDGVEFFFPAIAVPAETYLYIASDTDQFTAFFGFAPDFVDGAANVNGDDAIELFAADALVDVFGQIDVDGTGTPWDYLDGWAYRVSGTTASPTFDVSQWTFSGINAFDGETTNAGAAVPMPIETYMPPVGGSPCDPNATCENLPGAFLCTCNDGFSGDGLTCVAECDPSDCDDANVCTRHYCSDAGECITEPAPGTSCDDGLACTIDDVCDADAVCAGTVDSCDDHDACTVDLCTEADGCGHEALVCDDGDPETTDTCDSGLGCVYTPIACDDDNPCTTDVLEGDGSCSHTAVVCDDGNLCTDDVCDPASGCVFTNNTAPCADDDLCNGDEVCADGVCADGTALDCDDSDACTVDVCDAAAGCSYEALACDDGDATTEDSCAPDTGCVYTPIDCDDSDACTTDTLEDDGSCTYEAIVCEDENLCTTDSCDPASGCVYENNTEACDDGDACTADDICADGACTGAAVDCVDDDNICTDEVCDPVDGCSHVPNVASCDDGDPCTVEDTCAEGLCAGTTRDCGDDDVCTADMCGADGECVNEPIAGCCTDDEACTIEAACLAGVCTDENVCVFEAIEGCCEANADCDDDIDATRDVCDVESGTCVNEIVGCLDDDECADDDVCTVDLCAADGTCTHTADPLCCADDSECEVDGACLTGVCEANVCGVASIADCCTEDAECDDSDPNTEDTCDSDNGVCEQTPLVCDDDAACDDGNVCTTDTCDAELGCTYATVAGCCLDDDACSVDEVCGVGVCTDEHVCVAQAVEGCCVADDECVVDELCEVGVCTDEHVCETEAVEGCCERDYDCRSGEYCVDNVCVEGGDDTGATDTGVDTSRPLDTSFGPDSGDDSGDDDAGCGCTSAPSRPQSMAWLALIAAGMWVRRRRARWVA